MEFNDQDIVVAHDQMWDYGGAERVALELGKALESPVYTTYAGDRALEAAKEKGVDLNAFRQDAYQGIGSVRRREGFKSLSLALDWQTAPLEEFDIILAAHYFTRHYRTLDEQYMLCYCHSPPRWFNDLQKHRLSNLPRVARMPAKLYMTLMDILDDRSARRVDSFITNSEVVRERIRRYYRRDATVVYPPIDTESIRPGHSDGDYYLMLGRVVESKRPKAVVEAFNGLDYPLKIAGEAANEPTVGTSTFDEVTQLAGENVEFLGHVSDEEKQELLRRARGVIYVPIREDFGMVPIEALAAGTPVLAADEGFPKFVIRDGETGVIVNPTVSGIRHGIKRMESINFDPEELASESEKYGTERFRNEIQEALSAFVDDPDSYRVTEPSLLI